MKSILERIYENSPESHYERDGNIHLKQDAKISAEDVVRMMREFGNDVTEEQVKLCATWATATMNADGRASDSLNMKRFDLFTDCIRVKI